MKDEDPRMESKQPRQRTAAIADSCGLCGTAEWVRARLAGDEKTFLPKFGVPVKNQLVSYPLEVSKIRA